MTTFRNMRQRDRVGQSNQKTLKRLEEVCQHELTPLAELLQLDVQGSLPDPHFDDLSGTELDFMGSDILLTAGESEWFIQDKFRTSLQGCDLGIEFCRMFLFGNNGIVIDGGRDIYRQFPKPVPFTYEQALGNIKIAVRNWSATRTKCDLYLLHTRNSNAFIWMLAEPVKKIAHKLFATWCRKFTEIEAEVEVDVFGREITKTYNTLLESNMDIKCLREKREEEKKTLVSPTGEELRCYIAKTIVYIPFDTFTEGTEWVRTTRS